MSCPVATGGCTVGRPAPCRVPWGRGTSSKSPGHVCENGPAVLISKCSVSGEGDVFGCTCQSEQGDWGWGWGWRGGRTGLRSRASPQLTAPSSQLPAPSFTHTPRPGSRRVHPHRWGANRGLGKRITADRSTSVGNRPTEKLPGQSRPFCRPQSPLARTSLNLVSPLDLPARPSWLSSAAPFVCCTPRPPRGRGRTGGYPISIAVHFCGPVSAGALREPHNLSLGLAASLS